MVLSTTFRNYLSRRSLGFKQKPIKLENMKAFKEYLQSNQLTAEEEAEEEKERSMLQKLCDHKRLAKFDSDTHPTCIDCLANVCRFLCICAPEHLHQYVFIWNAKAAITDIKCRENHIQVFEYGLVNTRQRTVNDAISIPYYDVIR